MTTQYRSLDRSTHTAIFLASLLVAVSLLSSITMAFGPMVAHAKTIDSIEEVVVQG